MVNKYLLKGFSFILLLVLSGISTYGQETEQTPVEDVFACTMLIDNQSSSTIEKGSLEFIIHHRFGNFENKAKDLMGIYAPSNIRIGFNYGITQKLMVGVGTEKNNKLNDILWKYAILTQTEEGKMPVSVTYYGNMAIDARDEEIFGADYKFTNRLSYFHQLIISRKFNDKLSVLAAGSFSHINSVDSVWHNDQIGVTIAGRYKFYNEIAFMFEYDQPFSYKTVRYFQNEPKPNLALGVEFATPTHSFQITCSPFDKIVPQKNFTHNLNDYADKGMRLGFNITARF